MTRTPAALAALLFALVLTGCGGSPSDTGSASPAQPLTGHAEAPGADSWTPWPQALHDAQHTSSSTVVGPTTGAIRWKRRLEGNVTPGPVVGADGTIYAASNAGVLHALDPASGEDLWTVDGEGGYGIDLSTSPAVLPDGNVLWPGPQNRLWAISPDGDVLWTQDFDGLVTSPAVTADGDVAVGDGAGTLRLLHPDDDGPGQVWDVDLGESTYGSPVIAADGQTVYQSVLSGVVAVRDGDVLWTSHAPTEIVEVSAAVGPDGTVVVGTNDPFQYGLDPDDGSVRWTYRRDFWTYSSPSVTLDGVAYFGDHDNKITGVDVGTGKRVFQFSGSRKNENPGGIGIWTSVVVDAHHSAYVGTREGLVYGVDRDGELLWEIDAGTTVDSYPALAGDGALLIGTADGDLIAIADE